MAEKREKSVASDEKATLDPGRARRLANLRPFKRGDGRALIAADKGRANRKANKVISSALLAKLVRRRAKSVAEALIKQAEDGNVFAFNSLADRVEGKVIEKIEVSGNVELGVRIAAARARRRLAQSTSSDEVIDVTPSDVPQNSENM